MSFAKRVVGGTSLITLAGVGARLLSFITVPVLTPLLGPEPYGIAALAGTVVSLGTILALMGIDMAYARFYLQDGGDQRAALERFCWRFAGLGAVAIAMTAGMGWLWLGSRWLPDEHRLIALYSFFVILLSVAVTMATTRIRLAGHYRRLALALFAAALVSVTVNLVVALSWRADVWALLLGVLAGSVTSLALLGLPAPGVWLTRSNLPADTKRDVLALGMVGSITAPMYWIISSSDRWFLAEYATEADIGVYGVASSVASLGLMLNSSLILTWVPEASRLYGQNSTAALQPLGRLWERMVVGLALAWVAVAAAGGDVLRLLAAPQFHPGTVYIPWLAGGVFFYGLAALANTAFILRNRMRVVAWVWVAGAVVSLGLNALLVSYLSALGAALTQCFSYGLIALAILAASRRILPMPIDWGRLGLCLGLALIAGVPLSLEWAFNPLLSLLIKLPAGIIVSVVLMRIIAPDWYQRIPGYLRRGTAWDRR